MQIKIISILILGVLIISSCGGGEEPTEEVMDFEEFAGATGTDEDDSLDVVDSTETLDNSLVGNAITKLVSQYDTSSHDEFNTLDRFSFNEMRKVKFSGKEKVPYGDETMVTPIANFFYYSFADTVKTKNAFYNYLDGLATEGEGGPVKLNQDVDAIKMPPLFLVVYDTIIISAAYKCEHEANNWKAFEDSIFNVFGNEYKYYIDVECGGPLKWKK